MAIKKWNIEKMAALANILALIPGGYCAYGTWLLLHPSLAASNSANPIRPDTGGVVVSLFGAIGLVVVGSVLNYVAAHKRRPSIQSEPTAGQLSLTDAALVLQSAAAFDPEKYFRVAHYSQLTNHTDSTFRAIAAKYPADQREGFYAKFIGVGLVAYLHDDTWAYIFRSQILMLIEMNSKGGFLSLAAAKTFYDAAVAGNPGLYASYTFNQWLDFMTSHQLCIRHPSDMLEITVRGRDFLKYLVHWGRDASMRFN